MPEQELRRVGLMVQKMMPDILTIDDTPVFFSMIATIVDNYAIQKDVSDEDVMTFYRWILEVRPHVKGLMEVEAGAEE